MVTSIEFEHKNAFDNWYLTNMTMMK